MLARDIWLVKGVVGTFSQALGSQLLAIIIIAHCALYISSASWRILGMPNYYSWFFNTKTKINQGVILP